ncbi:uncharacterized protein LOC135927150 [Gordionus sp. m RMFG-2023]|uniref:uncharacterized protein LOC135927150 n=1 Tax=Gordionus sp. m RMFG-2023 TaxID=3053472 RepID=UPI0031FD06F3
MEDDKKPDIASLQSSLVNGSLDPLKNEISENETKPLPQYILINGFHRNNDSTNDNRNLYPFQEMSQLKETNQKSSLDRLSLIVDRISPKMEDGCQQNQQLLSPPLIASSNSIANQ